MKYKTMWGLPLLLSAFGYQVSWADPVQLKEIEVKGESLDEANSAFTVNVVDNETLRGVHLEQPLRFLEQVPGLYLGAYRQGGVADVFVIRGFAGAGHGGDAAVYVDGIPLNEGMSHSDGYADTNVLIPIEIQKAAIYKGPVSPLYGNFARGGTLAFTTRKGGEYQELDFAVGPWATYDAQAALGGRFGALDTNFALEAYHTDGWRENSGYDKSNAAARISYNLSDRSEISLSLRQHGGQWDAPGYQPQDQFDDDERRKLQAVNAENDGGRKRFTTQRIDFSQLLSDDVKLLVFAYGTKMDWTRWAKFGYTAGGQREDNYDRPVFGLGASLNGKKSIAGYAANWVAGVEYYSEDTTRERWSSANRVRQSLDVDRDFTINTASLFGQVDLAVNPRFRPTLGFRYDDFSGTYTNRDPGGAPFKNDMNSYNHFSPKLGVRSALTANWELRGSIANGFQLPEAEAKYDPTLNADPTEIWQYEIGLSGAPIASVYTDVAVFIADTTNEILEDPAGSGIFRNVGETRRNGVEAELRYMTPLPSLEIAANFAWFDSEITKNPNAALEGKQVTGVPEYLATLNVTYAPPTGLGAKAGWRRVGEYALTDDNSVSYDGFDVVNLGVFYNQKLEQGRSLRWHLDVNNAFDEAYAEAVFSGFGTINYAPAPPAHLTAGLTLKF